MSMTIAILTISDRCSRGEAADASGPALAELARERLGAQIVATAWVPDEIDQISRQLQAWATESPRPDLILTTGGTGLSSRDVTPEATARVLQRGCGQLLELARLRCAQQSPRAFLSRGECGTIARTLVLNLPGSTRGAAEFLLALADVLPHAIRILADDSSEHSPSPTASPVSPAPAFPPAPTAASPASPAPSPTAASPATSPAGASPVQSATGDSIMSQDQSSSRLPGAFKAFIGKFPELGEAHEKVAIAVAKYGPLDKKTCELVKIGLSIGAGLESALRSHVRRAMQHGATIAEIEQAVLLAMNTVGFPRTVAAWQWAWQQIERDQKESSPGA